MIDRAVLLSDLKKLLKLLQDDLRARCDEHQDLDAPAKAEWLATREAGRTAEDYTVWREEWLIQVSAAWLLATVFVRFMEDNGLITPPRLAGTNNRRRLAQDNRTQYFNDSPTHSDRDYLLHVFETVAALPAADRLFDRRHNPLWRLGPSGDCATRIVDFWQRIDPASGELVHDFTDSMFDTRFLGDLYQDLSDDARKKYALLQTPEFVEEFILDRTLTPAIEAFGYREVRLIDPACGSGHFLLGAFKRLFEVAQRHEPGTNSWELARRALAAVHGVDINPFAVAIARFRLLVAAVRACGITSLAAAPGFPLEIYAGDSLLLGRRLSDQRALNVPLDPGSAIRHALSTEDAPSLDRVLGQPYHVVVGNPPYITPKDSALNEAYRELYGSCHRQYSLAIPFFERFFDLAIADGEAAGYVGMITANSFMKRQFGKLLIEKYLSQWDLTHVIDTAGAYIPGHGTPTVILFGRHRRPVSPVVRTVLGIRGEPQTPVDPAHGAVWSAIVAQVDHPGSLSEFVSVADMPREVFYQHPWSIGGGGAAELKAFLDSGKARLASLIDSIGFASFPGTDDAFVADRETLQRTGVPTKYIRDFVRGEAIRDWAIHPGDHAFVPYGADFEPIPLDVGSEWARRLWPFRTTIGGTISFGGRTRLELGDKWWTWYRWIPEKYRTTLSTVFAFVATHNHFVLDRGGKVFKQSAPIIKMPAGTTEDDHLRVIALLNSSTACFWMKQTFQNKGSTVDEQGARQRTTPFEDFFEFTGTGVAQFPLAKDQPLSIARAIQSAADILEETQPSRVLRTKVEHVAEALTVARARRAVALATMVALQEELDWKCYELYGVIDQNMCAHEQEVPPISLGERAFEIEMARRMADGDLQTTWFERHGSSPTTEIPNHWPESYRRMVQKRLEVIKANHNVALIEQPEYKRRWNVETWETQQDEALRSWLLNRLEGQDYWEKSELTTCAQLAERAKHDVAFVTIAKVYLSSDEFDVLNLITELVTENAVPFLSVLRYKASGVRKREIWERTWESQRIEDAIDGRTSLPAEHPNRIALDDALTLKKANVGDIPVPPKYTIGDFRSTTIWRQRGKLDVPKERFISFPNLGREVDPSLVVAWAGWDHLQRARALATYYLLVKDQDGWPATRLTPLLAGLLELIPWLKQWHNDVDPETGERLGDYFDSFLETQARALGLTRAAIHAWKP